MSSRTGLELQEYELSKYAPVGYFVGLHTRFTSPLLLLSTYPTDWVDHYTNQAYAMRDPIVAWGFSTTGTCRWSELNVPDTFGILAEAREFGLTYGVSVACGEISSRTIGSVVRADREYTDEEINEISRIVNNLHEITEPPDSLTKAQVEALRLIAEGYRHTAAAAKLNISESALKARLTSARNKLLARTTAEAIQRAKEYRLM